MLAGVVPDVAERVSQAGMPLADQLSALPLLWIARVCAATVLPVVPAKLRVPVGDTLRVGVDTGAACAGVTVTVLCAESAGVLVV